MEALAPRMVVSRWVFLRCLGVIYLIAFVSLWTQMGGLIGSHGILPVQPLLQAAREQLGPERYGVLPTLCWFNASDVALHVLCGGGVVGSLLLLVGVTPALSLFALWAIYLSLLTVGRDFLSFQWDTLLLETGFLAIFFAPLQLGPRASRPSPPSLIILWLLRWLLFRLIFSSGVVKLASGDATWWSLTALQYHYETQPLPFWMSWYAHQLPARFQQLSVALMFAVELIIPGLIVGPRRCRLVACTALIAFQGLIMATGNYCFFNLLTIALCLLLLDDAVWPQRLRAFVARLEAVGRNPDHQGRGGMRWPRSLVVPLAALIVLLSTAPMVGLSRGRVPLPQPVAAFYGWLAPFHLVNGYGLFAVMTTSRPEIILEGSHDRQRWLAYEFPYKPGDVNRRPELVAPHQPRLDWQMWFAALGTYRSTPWFLRFCERLLEGSPQVLGLLSHNPFPERPPRYLRAVVYDYHFTDPATRRETGAWWRREWKGLYCPILSLGED